MQRDGYAQYMAFLDHLSSADRERLMADGSVRHVGEGEFLIRRGTQSGDLYWLESGRLEVVDARQNPEVVLDVLSAGRIVGEMSFVDSAPRTTDVRAMESSTVFHWSADTLHRLLDSDPGLSSRFFRALSVSAVGRLRAMDNAALHLREGSIQTVAQQLSAEAEEEARLVAATPRSVWMAAEESDRGSQELDVAAMRESIGSLSKAMNAWLSNITSVGVARTAGSVLRTELRPFLAKARAGQLGMEPRTTQGSRSRFLAHVLLNQPSGTDAIGEAIDAGLIDLPTCRGLRARTAMAVESAKQAFPDERAARVALLQPNCGALLARLLPELTRQGADLTVVDGDPSVLAFVDAGLQARPAEVRLSMVHADLSGLSSVDFGTDMDVVVIDGLLDYLPSRQLGTVLGHVRDSLSAEGLVVMTAMEW